MNAILNEFSGFLYLMVSGYLIYEFSRLLIRKGLKWALSTFVLAVLLIVACVAIQRGWAGLTRHLAEGGEFNVFMDESRGIVNAAASIVFMVGAYMFESETMEIKSHGKRLAIYTGLIGFTALLVVL